MSFGGYDTKGYMFNIMSYMLQRYVYNNFQIYEIQFTKRLVETWMLTSLINQTDTAQVMATS